MRSLQLHGDRDLRLEEIDPPPPPAAGEVQIRIRAAPQQLLNHPASGRPGRIDGTRELVITGTPYILPYRVRHDAIEILAVIHTSRQWPDQF